MTHPDVMVKHINAQELTTMMHEAVSQCNENIVL